MPPRTRTPTAPRHDGPIFTRPFPAAVTYDLSVRDQATITVPAGSTWTSGRHWHATHTEYLQVERGRAEITVGDTARAAVEPGEGVVTVPRGVAHEWRRWRSLSPASSTTAAADDEDLVVREWTEPRDGEKEAFFRALNALVLEAAAAGLRSWRARTLGLELAAVCWRFDNWPVVLGGSWWPAWAHVVATRAVLGARVVLGWVLGCRGLSL
ncbi:hypothetical protein F4779DRAFT_604688 [Xylariaceae sp. FL0662B]|nr:hypothetical protein F4779DRAFT_604688 [Xylariaceae sp. FL0662B]